MPQNHDFSEFRQYCCRWITRQLYRSNRSLLWTVACWVFAFLELINPTSRPQQAIFFVYWMVCQTTFIRLNNDCTVVDVGITGVGIFPWRRRWMSVTNHIITEKDIWNQAHLLLVDVKHCRRQSTIHRFYWTDGRTPLENVSNSDAIIAAGFLSSALGDKALLATSIKLHPFWNLAIVSSENFGREPHLISNIKTSTS